MSKGAVYSICAFNLLRMTVGKRVLVTAGSDITIGTLTAVEYKPTTPRLLNMIITLETKEGKVTLAKWNSLQLLREGEVE